jgi:hypothetical protein
MPLHVKTLLFILALCPQFILAQAKRFTAFNEDPARQQELITYYHRAFEQETASLPKENRKELIKFYQLRHDQIRSKIDGKELYQEPGAVAYLQKLTDEILSSNPLIRDRKLRFFFDRTGIPNASSMGEGLIVFNMGLFTKLANESQAAFIISHEIAHHHLKHSENSIAEYVETLYSAETQQTLKAVKRSQFNKAEQLDLLTTKLSFDSRRHSRDHETEADSLAVELLKNTRFDLQGAMSTLSLLDTVDSNSFNTAELLKLNFNANEYPFKVRWLKKPSGLQGGVADPAESAANDSLKTHPDCIKRIAKLQPLINKAESSGRNTFLIDSVRFRELQTQFDYEIVASALASGKLTSSLYHALLLLSKNPGDAYLVNTIGTIFKDLHQAQKLHLLGKSTELPSPQFPESYNVVLQFISNLYLEEYAAIGYYFMKKQEASLHTDQDFQKIYSSLSALNN